MKYLQRLALTVSAAVALPALIGASAASATELYSGNTTLGAGTEIVGSVHALKTNRLETTGGVTLVTCTEHNVAFKTSNAGSSTSTVSANISSLTWGGCTSTTDTVTLGSLEIHHIAGTNNGTVTSKGTVVTVNGIFGTSCLYGTGAGTVLGTLVGTKEAGKYAEIEINTVVTLQAGGSFCPSTAKWTSTWRTTKPEALNVRAN